MATKLYVGNLSFDATEDSVRELFSQYGEVSSVKLITDKDTGRPRGFGFVEMENADKAMEELNDKEFEGRKLKVNEAKPPQHSGGFNRGGYNKGGRGGYGGGRDKRERW
jgi:RNA recognition motif-containing protein